MEGCPAAAENCRVRVRAEAEDRSVARERTAVPAQAGERLSPLAFAGGAVYDWQ